MRKKRLQFNVLGCYYGNLRPIEAVVVMNYPAVNRAPGLPAALSGRPSVIVVVGEERPVLHNSWRFDISLIDVETLLLERTSFVNSLSLTHNFCHFLPINFENLSHVRMCNLHSHLNMLLVVVNFRAFRCILVRIYEYNIRIIPV